MDKELVRLFIIAGIVIAAIVVYQNYGGNLVKNEGMVSAEASLNLNVNDIVASGEALMKKYDKRVVNSQISDIEMPVRGEVNLNTNVLPNPQPSNNYAPQGNFSTGEVQNFSTLDCFPKDQLTAKDLIPREDAYNVWNDSNPPVQGQLSNKNFIESGHHYGINTVGQSLKNPNLQLRSDPLIPQREVGPWMQSTIEADVNRRPFEIGGY